MRKLGGETPHLSSSQWLLLFERKSLLWLYEATDFYVCLSSYTLRGPDSTLMFHKEVDTPTLATSSYTTQQWKPKPLTTLVH